MLALHCNVTDHPTTEWTLQKLRGVSTHFHSYRFMSTITIPSLSPTMLDSTQVQMPKANAYARDL